MPGVALRTTFIVGFPGETEADVDELCGVRRRPRVRSRRRVHLFARGRHVGLRARRRRAGEDEDGAARPRDGAAEAARRARGSAAGSASAPASLVDGPSSEHELVLKGRLATQAPDIDAVGLPDRMRPVGLPAGRFCRGRNRRRPGLRPDRPARRRTVDLDGRCGRMRVL